MERPVFKTFEPTEGLMAILTSSFLALMLTLRANAIEPSQKAIEMTNRLKNNKEVSCCELKRVYRRMALELHPDKGGSDEDMVHLNNARDTRRDCSQQKIRGCSKSSSKSKPSKTASKNKSKGKPSKTASKNKSKGKPSKTASKNKSKGKSSKSKSTKGKSDKSKKTQGKSFESGRLFAGGVLAGGVVGLVVNAMGERKSPKPHVRNPTSPRHR